MPGEGRGMHDEQMGEADNRLTNHTEAREKAEDERPWEAVLEGPRQQNKQTEGGSEVTPADQVPADKGSEEEKL
ncbi:hypothetical protein NDU88_005679 [Pleurodeles waltl]|uniref:Uncharacterized protein n=1 Tax=Pleurodeles waltl TaxID=8319 RepID=A0AAV7SMI4_PLEWA|nr:hypothetical protein NDU88_005679 [Pleurodeles waltl]